MPIKTIIFDLGNTVVNFDHARAVERILSHSDKSFEEILNLFFDSDITERFETGKITPEKFYKEVKALLGLKLDYKNFLPIWNEIFFRNRDTEELVKKLKGKYRLLLLSNVNELHMAYIKQNFDIIKFFDEVITSYEVGARKPAKLIYQTALKKANCSKDELIYTDDREDLVKASISLGIPSIRFKNASQLKEDFKKLGIVLNGD